MINQQNDYIRNNKNLKAPNITEYVDPQTFNQRLDQVKKIKNNIQYFAQKYFYIISLDEGKKIIKLYPKQAELVKSMSQKKRLICLSCRQSRKMLFIKYIDYNKK